MKVKTQEDRQFFTLNFDEVMSNPYTHPSRTSHQLASRQVERVFAYGAVAEQHFAPSSKLILSFGPPLWFLNSPLIYFVE